jgi:hypothetical protein
MGFFDFLKGGKNNPANTSDFGRIDPNNQQAFWAVTSEFGQAAMHGPAGQQQFFAKYGIRDQAHWSAVQATLMTKWANQPGGPEAMSASAYANSAAQTAALSQQAMAGIGAPPPEATAPVEGITLEQYAGICVAREGGNPQQIAAKMGQFQVDEARFARIDAEWKRRMDMSDPSRAVAAATLSGQFQMLLAQARMPRY